WPRFQSTVTNSCLRFLNNYFGDKFNTKASKWTRKDLIPSSKALGSQVTSHHQVSFHHNHEHSPIYCRKPPKSSHLESRALGSANHSPLLQAVFNAPKQAIGRYLIEAAWCHIILSTDYFVVCRRTCSVLG